MPSTAPKNDATENTMKPCSPALCLRLPTLAAVLLAIAGCVRIPVATMQATATDYNVALQRASEEQLLLNLVRLRYHEPPFFMEPSAVSAQLRRNAELSASAAIADAAITERSAGVGGRLTFTEQPTLTFIPLRGEAFMAKVLSRLDLSTLLLLYHSGWDIERVFRLCVDNLNQIVNAASASGSLLTRQEEHDRFREAMRLLRRLRLEGAVDFGYVGNGDAASAVIALSRSSPSAKRFRERLQLDPTRTSYRLELGTLAEAKDRGAVVIGTRSVMGILFFLSRGVDVPASDLPRVTGATHAASLVDKPHPSLFHLHVTDREPVEHSLSTRYRNHWFYIDDTDRSSKQTLTLLSQLFSIQSGEASTLAPVLTLPAGDAP